MGAEGSNPEVERLPTPKVQVKPEPVEVVQRHLGIDCGARGLGLSTFPKLAPYISELTPPTRSSTH